MTITTRESAVLTHLRAVSARQQASRTSSANSVLVAVEPATAAMVKLIDSLLVEREHTTMTDSVIDGIKANKPQAHRFITFLLDQPRVQAQPVAPVKTKDDAPIHRLNFDAISDGNYAIWVEGVIKYYRVSTNGTWKNVQARASDELYPVKGKAGIAILHKIVEAGLEESQMLFARTLKHCWKCNKSLTDMVSKERGMGPDCYAKGQE